MHATTSRTHQAIRANRHLAVGRESARLRYKHLAFGVGLALGSLLVCGVATAASGIAANTAPTGGQVVGGVGSITRQGASTIVNQQSKLLSLNWQTFNVGKDASVLFKQPGTSAVALNRILDQNPSQIFGKISSNGQIFLINTHGIIFGSSAQLNVGGLVASTLDLTPTDFLAQHYNLDAHGGSAGVVNHGTIAAASGGSVSLIGGQVENDGLIIADYGHINLDGADQAVLNFDGDGLINVTLTGALKQRLDADQAAVVNKGTLAAQSGTVVLQASAAKNLFTNLVNNSGVIDAHGISTAGGVVRLVGSGGNVIDSGSINVSGTTGGSAQLLSDQNVGVTGGSINASGTQGGGSIRVGGGWQGGEGLPTASAAYIAPDATLNADATQFGNGGSVVVWGNNVNNFYGSISARGGIFGGNGGRVETSSHYGLNAQGSVDASAPNGQAGSWLMDPYDVEIVSTGTGSLSGGIFSSSSTTSTITPGIIETALEGGTSVAIFTGGGGSNNPTGGDITVTDPIAVTGATGASTLSLQAAGSIFLNAGISGDGTHALNVNLWANYGGAAGDTTYTHNSACVATSGCVVVIGNTAGASSITTDGGNLDIETGPGYGGGALTLGYQNAGNIDTGTGNLIVSAVGISQGLGSVKVGGTSTFDTDTGTGDITLANSGNDFIGLITVNGAGAVELNGSGTLDMGAVSNTFSLTLDSASTLNDNITTSGAQTYKGAVALGANVTLTTTNSNVTFGSTVANAVSGTPEGLKIAAGTGVVKFTGAVGSAGDALGALEIDGTGDTTLGSTVNAASLTTNTGTTTLDGNVTTSGTQTYKGTLALSKAITLTGTTVNLAAVTGNNHNLTVAGNAVLNGVVTAPNLSVTGTGNELNFGTAGSVSGNVDAATLDYDNYATAVTFDAANGNNKTTGIGGKWTGVGTVIGNGTNAGIIGLGAGTFTLSGMQAGSSGLIAYSGITAADAATVAGATGFDDGAKKGEGITFTDATKVSGSGTVSNVDGDFNDGTGKSTASNITYTGFGTVEGTSTGGVTGVTGDFDDGTGQSSKTSIFYTGFGKVTGTSSGSVTDVTGNFDDGTGQSSVTNILYTGFGTVAGTSSGSVTDVTGNFDDGTGESSSTGIIYTDFGKVEGTSSGSVTDVTGNFDDGTGESSATNVIYSGFGAVVGTGGGSVTGVSGAFDDSTRKSSISGITYTGFDAVTGTGGSVTGVTGDFDVDTDVSGFSHIDYSGFNLGTVAGSGGAATLTGTADTWSLTGSNAGSVGSLGFTGFGNIDDAAGTVDFGTAGSLGGNVTANALDYAYIAPVTVNLSGTGSTGVAGTVSGVSSITSLNSLAVTGTSAGALGLTTTGAGATTTLGNLTVNGNLGVDSAGAVLQGGTDALIVTGTTGINAHANAITLGNSGNSLAGVVTLSNTGANDVTLDNGTHALQLGNVHVGTGALTLTGTGITQATGTTVTQGGAAGAATFNAGAGVLTLTNAGNDLTGTVGLSNSGAYAVTFDNGTHTLNLGNVNVGTGTLDIGATGITQLAGTGITQAPGAGAASFNARSGVLNLNSTLNDLTGVVNLANAGSFLVYLDNGGNALTLGTLNVGSGPLTITDYGVGPLLLTQNVTTSGGAVTFGGAVTIDGSPTVTIDTTGSGAAGANISFGGDVNAAAANADSLALIAGNGAVSFGGSVGNTAKLANLTTNSKTFSLANTLNVDQALSITTTAGPISQSAAWQVGGASMFDAGSNAITLANTNNIFGGPITVTGGAVELGGSGSLDMGAVNATSLTLDGASTLHDDITTSGAQTYNGAVTLDGSGDSVALVGNGITFGSTIDNLSSATAQALTVDSGTGAAKFGGAVGGVNGALGALSVTGTGQAQFLGNVAAASLDATAPVLLGASISTSGDQDYHGAVALGGNIIVSSSNGNVTFASTLDNAASGTPESLTVTAADGAVTFGNAVGTLNGRLGNLASSSATFSDSGALNVGGNLNVATTGGSIVQGAIWKVTGNSVFDAGNNAVSLTNTSNDFTGSVTLIGMGVAVTDVNDLTIGGLTDINDGDVSLIAGGQLFGVGAINAGTGSITLKAQGAVLTTAALTGGNISLTGGNGISLGDDVKAGGTLTLSSGGNISESATSVITANALTGASTGSTHLDGNNLIANIGNFTANGFSLTNAQALTVASGITLNGAAGGTALKTTAGDLTIDGTVGNAAGTTSLTSAGAINEGATGGVIAATLTGTSVGDTTLTGSNNKIASVGQFKAVNFTLVDNAALSVVGPLLTTGNISLTTTGSAANVLNVGQALTGGSVTLDSAGDLSITQQVQGSAVNLTANGNLSIGAAVNSGAGSTTLTQNGAGSISESPTGSITAGSLTGTAQGGATLDGANAIGSLGNFSANGFALNNATNLTVAAGSTVDGGNSASLTTTGAGSNITINGRVNGSTINLVSAGGINEGASGVVTAGTLTGSAVNGAQLTGTNAIANLGNFSTQGLALTNGQSLTIASGATVDGGASTTLTTTGAGSNLAINGTLRGATTTLLAAGAVSEGANGALVAGTLTGSSVGSTTLTGHNSVANLGNYTADGFNLATASGLTVVAGNTVDGGGSTTLTTTGTGHDLAIDGRVRGSVVKLVSTGAIGEGAAGGITAATLTGSSTADTTLKGANQIAGLGAFSARNFYLTDAHALAVGGPLTTGGAGNISLVTTGGSGNTLTVNQAVHGAAITMTSAGDLTVANAIVGTTIGLTANGNLAIDAAVDSGSGMVTLTQNGAGSIVGGANGGITAGTLTGTSAGATALGSANQFMDNHVGVLGGFVSPGGFSFTNDGTLTLASVNGSAFTVNAGQSPVYLAVENGDLLQNGSNWLYDSVGTWASTGHIGLSTAPIYVMGVSNQTVASIGLPPAYFYAVDQQGNLLPLTSPTGVPNSVNVPGALATTSSQGVNGHSDHYIDPSVLTAIYRPYGVVAPGVLLPPDQLECSPDQAVANPQCPENN